MVRVLDREPVRQAELAELVIRHGRSTPARVAAVVAAVCGVVAASFHGLVVPEHMMDYSTGDAPGWLPLAFAVSAAFGLVWAGSLAAGLSRTWLALGVVLNGAMVAAGLASRTVGLPGAGIEDPSGLWAVATIAEGLALVLCVVLLSWRSADGWRPARARILAVLGLALVVSVAAGLVLAGASEVIGHAKMLAGWMWAPFHPLAGWMWLPAHPHPLAGWMWWATLVRWG